MTDAAIASQLQALNHTVQVLAATIHTLTAQTGSRINRAALCERQGVHRNTLLRRLQTDKSFPRPGPDGKWSLADVAAWELRNRASQ